MRAPNVTRALLHGLRPDDILAYQTSVFKDQKDQPALLMLEILDPVEDITLPLTKFLSHLSRINWFNFKPTGTNPWNIDQLLLNWPNWKEIQAAGPNPDPSSPRLICLCLKLQSIMLTSVKMNSQTFRAMVRSRIMDLRTRTKATLSLEAVELTCVDLQDLRFTDNAPRYGNRLDWLHEMDENEIMERTPNFKLVSR